MSYQKAAEEAGKMAEDLRAMSYGFRELTDAFVDALVLINKIREIDEMEFGS